MNDESALTRTDLAEALLSPNRDAERVGLELEHGLVDIESGQSVVYEGPAGSQALLETMAKEFAASPIYDQEFIVGIALEGGSLFTLETGGALEYSSLAMDRLSTAVTDARLHINHAADIADRFGIALLSGGVLPFTNVADIPWTPKPRVQIMRKHFAGLGDAGAHGDSVMGLTLSAQTSLDYLSEADLMEKLRLHVAAAPIIAALFVNSPIADGADCGALSRRMQFWRKFEPDRCGVLDFALAPDAKLLDFVDWATKFPMIYRESAGRHVAGSDRTFREALKSGFDGGAKPTINDWELHLNQVWPHVRVRRTLEMRASDGPPWPHFASSAAIWVGLTYDQAVRHKATNLLADLTASQLTQAADDIAIKGLAASAGPFSVNELACELLRLSRTGLASRVEAGREPEEVLDFLDPLDELADRSETFADRCLSRWDSDLRRDPKRYVAAYRV